MPNSKLPVTALLAAALLGAACGRSEPRPAPGASASTLAAATATPPAGADSALDRAADRARVEGGGSSAPWVVEVSDFQCPFCRDWHVNTYPTIKKDYIDTGKIRFAYINYPLPIHRNAWPAAEAAMCAAAQGKFWPMHDALFATQDRWGELPDPSAVLDSLAGAVGVDTTTWRTCVTKQAMKRLIQADADRATESGARSTPTFFIGGRMIEGAQPTDVFVAAIDQALAKK